MTCQNEHLFLEKCKMNFFFFTFYFYFFIILHFFILIFFLLSILILKFPYLYRDFKSTIHKNFKKFLLKLIEVYRSSASGSASADIRMNFEICILIRIRNISCGCHADIANNKIIFSYS